MKIAARVNIYYTIISFRPSRALIRDFMNIIFLNELLRFHGNLCSSD